jgi:chaperonin GroEL
LTPETGHSLPAIQAPDLGSARRVEANADEMIVVGDPQRGEAIRFQLETLGAQLAALPEGDEAGEELRLRAARLAGRVATLKIGAYTKVAREARRERAKKAIQTLPLALREGVVAGGGVAYLNCIPAVRRLEADGDEAWGITILARALEEPFRCLIRNSGPVEPGGILAEIERLGPGFGYDVVRGAVVEMNQAGIMDAAGVLRLALQTAVSGAVMALTTDTIVLKRRPKQSLEP